MAQIVRSKVISPSRKEQGHDDARKRVYPQGRYGATLKNIRIAPNKVRLVIDQIRGERVERAREILRFSSKRAAYMIDRVLLSALGNADVKSQGRVGADELVVSECYCDEGTRLRRWKAGPMGRVRPIIRRLSHITVVLGEPKNTEDGQAAETEAAAEGGKKASKKGAKSAKKKADKKPAKKK